MRTKEQTSAELREFRIKTNALNPGEMAQYICDHCDDYPAEVFYVASNYLSALHVLEGQKLIDKIKVLKNMELEQVAVDNQD